MRVKFDSAIRLVFERLWISEGCPMPYDLFNYPWQHICRTMEEEFFMTAKEVEQLLTNG